MADKAYHAAYQRAGDADFVEICQDFPVVEAVYGLRTAHVSWSTGARAAADQTVTVQAGFGMIGTVVTGVVASLVLAAFVRADKKKTS